MELIDFLRKIGLGFLFKEPVPGSMPYEAIQEERNAAKKEVADALKEINFTEMEIKEVLLIADDAERKIDILKTKLVGTNLGDDDPAEITQYIKDQIQHENEKMNADMRKKVAEIQARKRPQ